MKKIFSIILSLCLFGTAYGTAFTTDCGNTVSITATPATGYHFTQWQDGNTDNPRQVEVKASANFTASFAPNEYTIIFQNEDGTELQNSLFAYGTTPVYDGETPTKPASAQYSYTFAGWSPAITTVTGDATYTATYTSTVNHYTLTLSGENGIVTGAGSYEYGSVVTISATPLECYQFKQWSDGDTNATREITITDNVELEAIFEVITYTITIESANQNYGTVSIEVVGDQDDTPSTDVPSDGHEYVDLGLSVKWATCNVGATKPEEAGNYFAWGEVETKETYNWSTYKWCEGTSTTLTKYNNNSTKGVVDSITVLEAADDAAHVHWGNNWRMPTDAEWTELREQCTWEGTTQNGVQGLLVTGTNGNSIFLPLTGSMNESELKDLTTYGNYWSSTLREDSPITAWRLNFNTTYPSRSSYSRYRGHAVRAVCP